MPLEHKDRVSDTSNTTGTGTLTLVGAAPTGRRTFASAHTNGATIHYTIQSSDGTQWEVGEGVWTSSGSTLTRVTVFASSNAGALVNFTGTPLTVISTMTSADAGSVSGIMDKIEVYLGTAQNSPSNATAKINFDTVSYDTNSLWNSSNKRIIPKKAGYYTVFGYARATTGGAFVALVVKNGSVVVPLGVDGVAGVVGGSGSWVVYCNGTTDYLELFCYTSTSSAYITGASGCRMQALGPF